MRLIRTILATLALSAAFVSAYAANDRKSEKEEIESMVKDAVNNHTLAIEVDFIVPTGMPSFNSTEGYTLRIKDGKVKAFLPYFGTGYAAMISGVDEANFNFDDCEIKIEEDNAKAKRGKYTWRFSTENGSENVDVTINFDKKGYAEISCDNMRKSNIRYSGKLIKVE